MRPGTILIILWIMAAGCVELYEFRINNKYPSLVIEGQISDLSYREYMEIPADGRYFTVRLSQTSHVANERNQPVKDASVILVDSEGNIREYVASELIPGIYILFDEDFKAIPGMQYQLKVMLPEGASFESEWEQLPEKLPGPMGDINFEEVIRQQYDFRNNERELVNVRGVNVMVELPSITEKEHVYYQWDFNATWIYRATLASITSPVYRCWITDPYYLTDYVMHEDNVGGYKKDLFFLRIDGNDRIFDRISMLISQYAMSEHYYNYLTEIRQQDERKGLFDPPPFNLLSNLHSEDPDLEVYGYFSVVGEQGARWDFMRTDLEFPVPNTWREFCTDPTVDPPSKCFSCLEYGDGIPSNVKPWWWEE
ncbi:MAG: DUF4249 domain-containing protein [Cyclobacteriaceae bacterium]|nr:DUF4249 domain-containing protein [Cyclobacteriaceae bacterium]